MKPVLARVHPRAAAKQNFPDVLFYCPGCKHQHGVWTDKAAGNGARWSWNGDMVRPTFSQSLLITYSVEPTDAEIEAWNNERKPWPRREVVCHSFVVDGRIQFLGDCTHALAGQTVDIPPVE